MKKGLVCLFVYFACTSLLRLKLLVIDYNINTILSSLKSVISIGKTFLLVIQCGMTSTDHFDAVYFRMPEEWYLASLMPSLLHIEAMNCYFSFVTFS